MDNVSDLPYISPDDRSGYSSRDILLVAVYRLFWLIDSFRFRLDFRIS